MHYRVATAHFLDFVFFIHFMERYFYLPRVILLKIVSYGTLRLRYHWYPFYSRIFGPTAYCFEFNPICAQWNFYVPKKLHEFHVARSGRWESCLPGWKPSHRDHTPIPEHLRVCAVNMKKKTYLYGEMSLVDPGVRIFFPGGTSKNCLMVQKNDRFRVSTYIICCQAAFFNLEEVIHLRTKRRYYTVRYIFPYKTWCQTWNTSDHTVVPNYHFHNSSCYHYHRLNKLLHSF